MYVVHFGGWMTFMFGAQIHKDGIPTLKKLPNMLKVAVITASILAIFSSHSHHYLKNMVPDSKILHGTGQQDS